MRNLRNGNDGSRDNELTRGTRAGGSFGKAYAGIWLSTLGRTVPFGDPVDSPHDTVECEGISVDRHIAPLIEALWSGGIKTHNSCQGDPWLDERAHAAAPNFYGGCYAATVTVGSVEDARLVMAALETAMLDCIPDNERHRVNTTFGVEHGVFVSFPAKALITPGFLAAFTAALPALPALRESTYPPRPSSGPLPPFRLDA